MSRATDLTAQKAACARAKLGVVFVIDDSGSNVEVPTDPNYLRAAAFRAALPYLPEGTIIAAERFASDATEIFGPRKLTRSNRDSLAAAVRNALESSGETSYDAAFIEANSLLRQIRGVQRKAVIFISDGLPTDSYSADRAIAAQKIPIYTVGYGDASKEELIGIARRSGGLSFQIDSVSNAVNAFGKIVNRLVCNPLKVDVTFRVRAGQTRTIRFFVPKKTPGFSALVTWDSGNPRISLRRPNGTVVTPSSDVTIDRSTPNTLRIDVSSPPPGTWKLIVIAERSGDVSVHFNLWTTPKQPPSGACIKALTAGPATLTTSCWQRVAMNRFRAFGDLRVNGILVAGAGEIDVDLTSLRLTAAARTWIVSGVPIAAGRLDVTLDRSFSVGATGSLHGLRLSGVVTIDLEKGGKTKVAARLALPLPGHPLDLVGDVRFTVDRNGSANLDNLHVTGEGEVPFGGFTLKNVELDYTRASDVWKGGATIRFDAVNAEATGSASFKSGSFVGAAGAVKARVALGAGFFLDQVKVRIELAPKPHLFGGAAISFGPKAIIKGDLALNFWPLWLWQVDGTVTIADGLLKRIGAHARVDGTFALHTQRGIEADVGGKLDVGLDFPPLAVRGNVSGYISPAAFNIEGRTSTQMGGLRLETEGVVSSTGIAGCATTKLKVGFISRTQPVFGFSYRWGNKLPYVGGCEVANFRVARSPLSAFLHTAGASTTAIKVGANLPFEIFTVESATGDPQVLVRGPGSETFDSRAGALVDSPEVFVFHYPAIHQTFVAVARPRPGTWQVEQLPGTPTFTNVTAADGLRPVAIRASVRGKGLRRVLRYRIAGLRGRRISFFQSHGTAPGSLPILRRARGSGAVRFKSERGLAPLHFVTAVISQRGVAVETRPVAYFRTAVPRRPGPVSGFRIGRDRRSLIARWRFAPRAAAWRIQVRSSDGRRFIRTLGVPRHRFRLAVAPKTKIFVSVRGVDRYGRVGSLVGRVSTFRRSR